ncbi:hypothetical protein CLAFUW4_08218 [Fulvia fulva]|uniref:Uncharacterized protein n=1 Tax=Passalora fulva TaxID=5499 RepID=A0A9Q8LCC7_PASFU|nr:uncharacterized protein CLAFUR5_08330 [Fulvia fulva]KAK4628876.1 hypothetical protein CLAFUR4_08223 [Fulvia fulva]KAK4630076.1 hypothetical protein CLAFUR0_08218 [Fulvia fulva]UJO14916.1 hypothetical protein CLAFUR5_08330 [Fulvia fulva]WPV12844.1 hypothetical protein CLAFUW4_08218 [Fulvia fulva]WPV27652.1 hypothetical protein CLAFUW7_08218 [Fulvia fulva]
MASPSSSGVNSVASTPSITITDDHGRGESLKLPDASLSAEPERPRSITFEAPTPALKDLKPVPDGTPPIGGIKGTEVKNSLETGPGAAPTPDPTSTAKKERPAPKRTGSGILTELKQQMSSNNLFHHHKTHGVKANGIKSVATSGTASPRTPEVQALFEKDLKGDRHCPNLDAVNRALESLRASAAAGDQYVSNLEELAKVIQRSRTDSRKALTDAMKARDQGQHEVCRALCLSIVQNKHAEADTQVYAYNILSTQASPGQAMTYLNEAYKLAKENEARGLNCDKMLEVIAVLREGAMAKDGAVASKGGKTGSKGPSSNGVAGSANSKLDLDAGELDKKLKNLAMEDPNLRRDSLSPKDLLAVPKGDLPSGMLTPKTEKIFKWAAKQQA